MKKLIIIAVMAGAAVLWNMHPGVAQDKAAAAKYEYGIVKWDGPDRLFYNLPEKFELAHLAKSGVQIPHDAQEEEWCLAYAANQMAREGWETITLDSRRIVLRRAK
jgi:hypothetical protein